LRTGLKSIFHYTPAFSKQLITHSIYFSQSTSSVSIFAIRIFHDIYSICWGFRLPHARTGGVLIGAQWRVKHTDTILRGSAKPPTSTGESPYYLEIEKGYNKYMEEDHSTPSHTLCCKWQQGCCPWQQLLFLSFSLLFTFSHPHTLSLICSPQDMPFYRHFLAPFSST